MGIRGVVDTGNRTAEELELEASSLTPGWFRATVADVYEDDGNLKLKFDLADGRTHLDTLWDPTNSDNDRSAERLQQRRAGFSVRLGLVPREGKGRFEFDWLDAIGKPCILHLVLSKPNKDGRQFINLEWMGLFAIDDSRAPAPLRGPSPQLTGMTEAAVAALSDVPREADKRGRRNDLFAPVESPLKTPPRSQPLDLEDL